MGVSVYEMAAAVFVENCGGGSCVIGIVGYLLDGILIRFEVSSYFQPVQSKI